MGTTIFVWDPVFDCVTHELDENNNVKAEYHNEPQQFGGVLSQRRGTTTHYHHHDALGSTRFLTDSSGNVTDTYLHDAWGNAVASTGTTVNPFRWVGKYGYYTDNSTGQVYVRARMYQPTTAQWASADPLLWLTEPTSISIQTLYAFAYALANPISRRDESGLFSRAIEVLVEHVSSTGLGDTSCPTAASISWSFRPRSPNGWPCDGLLAQLVDVTCQESKCADMNSKEDTRYIETWSIRKGGIDVFKPKPSIHEATGKSFNDTARFMPDPKTWGYYMQTVQLCVFCNSINRKDGTGNHPHLTASEIKWLTHDGGVRTESRKCRTSSGRLKGREISKENEKQRFEEIWAKRIASTDDRAFYVDWDCCCQPTEQFAEGGFSFCRFQAAMSPVP